MSPIFLDFMCPDAWKTYSTIPSIMTDVQKNYLLRLLSGSLNYSVLLTDSYCLLPPAFIFQSDIIYEVIYNARKYLELKEILLPLKETSMLTYIEKKAREYQYVRDNYNGFYNRERVERFLDQYGSAFVHRTTSMGLSIAKKWEKESDKSPIWKPIIQSIPLKADEIRLAPSQLNSRGISITLEAILKYQNLPPIDDIRFAINQAIQHDYISSYLLEYNAKIISNIPPKPFLLNYTIGIESRYFDYAYLIRVLRKIGNEALINLISLMKPEEIYELKNMSEYQFIREKYKQCCDSNVELYKVFRSIEIIQSKSGIKYIDSIDVFKNFLMWATDYVDRTIDGNKAVWKESENMMKKIFISYKAEDKPIADIINQSLITQVGSKIQISRYTDLNYKDSFRAFMNSIEEHDYVLTIVSDKYLKSKACMYEVGEVIKSHSYEKKLLHIILGKDDVKYYPDSDAFAPPNIFSTDGQLDYIQYWQKQYDDLENRIKSIKNIEATRVPLRQLSEIGHILRYDIQEFMDYLCNNNAKSFGILYSTNFYDIIQFMGLL